MSDVVHAPEPSLSTITAALCATHGPVTVAIPPGQSHWRAEVFGAVAYGDTVEGAMRVLAALVAESATTRVDSDEGAE